MKLRSQKETSDLYSDIESEEEEEEDEDDTDDGMSMEFENKRPG